MIKENRKMSSNIRKSIVILSLALLVVAFSRLAMADGLTTTSVNATANVRTALACTNNEPLSFGSFIPDADGGTVTSTNIPGEFVTIAAPARGDVIFTGTVGAHATVSFVTRPVTLSNGVQTMGVILKMNTTEDTVDLIFDTAGEANVKIDGTLTVAAGQHDGTYTGAYTLNIVYTD